MSLREENAEIVAAAWIPEPARAVVQRRGMGRILAVVDAPFLKQLAEVVAPVPVPMLASAIVELRRADRIHRDAAPFRIGGAKEVTGQHVLASHGVIACLVEEQRRPRMIARDRAAVLVVQAETEACGGVSARAGRFEERDGAHRIALEPEHADERRESDGVAALRVAARAGALLEHVGAHDVEWRPLPRPVSHAGDRTAAEVARGACAVSEAKGSRHELARPHPVERHTDAVDEPPSERAARLGLAGVAADRLDANACVDLARSAAPAIVPHGRCRSR